ncbi:MAG: hypothetical protein AAF950_17820 [Pseudomonadota bacterium]
MSDNTNSGRKLSAYTLIISLPFAAITQFLFGLGSGGDPALYFNASAALSLDASQASAFYFGMWFDVFGYYLIYLPVILYAWRAYRDSDQNLVDLLSICGIIYTVFGALGAATMAASFQTLHVGYAGLDSVQKNAAEAAWLATISGQWLGVWKLEAILATVWLGGLSKVLIQHNMRWLGIGALLVAIIWLAQFVTWVAGAHDFSNLTLMLVVVVGPLWAFCLGIALLRAR